MGIRNVGELFDHEITSLIGHKEMQIAALAQRMTEMQARIDELEATAGAAQTVNPGAPFTVVQQEVPPANPEEQSPAEPPAPAPTAPPEEPVAPPEEVPPSQPTENIPEPQGAAAV